MWRVLTPFSGQQSKEAHNRKDMAKVASVTVVALSFLGVHSLFLLYYLFISLQPLIIANILSVLLYVISIFLNHKGKTSVAIFLINFEICLYCILNMLLLGWNAGTQWFLPTAMLPCQITYPLSRRRQHQYMLLFAVTMLVCYLLRWYAPPIYTVGLNLIILMNILTVMGGSAILLQFSSAGIALTELYYKQKIDNLSSDVYTDSLTGLWNRRYAMEQMEELTVGKPPVLFSLAMLDVDLFKRVNDTYGHPFGDIVLKRLCELILQQFRSGDIAVRWGGEEFLLILPGADSKNTQTKMEQLRQAVQQMVITSGEISVGITVTIGISEYRDGMDINQVIDRSDRALYYGKEHGRNQVVQYSTIPLDKLSGNHRSRTDTNRDH